VESYYEIIKDGKIQTVLIKKGIIVLY